SRRRHTRFSRDWSSDVCSSDLTQGMCRSETGPARLELQLAMALPGGEMSNLRTLVFFATPPHDCSYLPDREATTMFVDPRAHIEIGRASCRERGQRTEGGGRRR